MHALVTDGCRFEGELSAQLLQLGELVEQILHVFFDTGLQGPHVLFNCLVVYHVCEHHLLPQLNRFVDHFGDCILFMLFGMILEAGEKLKKPPPINDFFIRHADKRHLLDRSAQVLTVFPDSDSKRGTWNVISEKHIMNRVSRCACAVTTIHLQNLVAAGQLTRIEGRSTGDNVIYPAVVEHQSAGGSRVEVRDRCNNFGLDVEGGRLRELNDPIGQRHDALPRVVKDQGSHASPLQSLCGIH